MTFPEDAAVYQLVHQPTSRNNGQRKATNSRLEWDEDGQHLRRGFLNSRTAAQFMVVARGRPNRGYESAPGNPPQVTNELGAAIQYVVLRDAIGDYYSGESIANKAVAKLTKTPLQDCQKNLKSMAMEVGTGYPPGYDPSMHENLVTWMMPNYGRWSIDGGSTGPTTATSILEMNLAQLGYSKADGYANADFLEPGTYLAVVDSPPDVPLGIKSVRQKASLHVIRGRY